MGGTQRHYPPGEARLGPGTHQCGRALLGYCQTTLVKARCLSLRAEPAFDPGPTHVGAAATILLFGRRSATRAEEGAAQPERVERKPLPTGPSPALAGAPPSAPTRVEAAAIALRDLVSAQRAEGWAQPRSPQGEVQLRPGPTLRVPKP